jgi:hypothetical protein
VQLIEDSLGDRRYATLSHCWGIQKTCITTSKNLEQRKSSIPWAELPSTYQEAIVYCLQLEIYYLWIDALCIIQDNDLDWQEESAKMAKIYQNSYLTIAATAAASDTTGCFGHSIDISVEHRVCGNSEHDLNLSFRRKLDHWGVPVNSRAISSYPLLTRGWAFQERILSARTIHFCKNEIVWECNQTISCECGGIEAKMNMKSQFSRSKLESASSLATEIARSGAILNDNGRGEDENSEEDDVDGRIMQNFHPMHRRSRVGKGTIHTWADRQMLSYRIRGASMDSMTRRNLYQRSLNAMWSRDPEVWHRMVEEYSCLQLTNPTDCLPAFSGLAQRTSTADKYLAGLWSDTIVRDLLWRVDQLNLGSKRAVQYRGPSWSWVSVNSRISYWTRDELKDNVFHTFIDALDSKYHEAPGFTNTWKRRMSQVSEDAESQTSSGKEKHRIEAHQYEDSKRRKRKREILNDYNRAEPPTTTLEHLGRNSKSLDNINLGDLWHRNKRLLDSVKWDLLDWSLFERASSCLTGIKGTVSKSPHNPFGEVSNGSLVTKGWLLHVSLKYVKNTTSPEGGLYGPLKYEISINETKGMVDVGIIHLPFYADYVLSDPGDGHMPSGTSVYLLEVLVNVCIVLRETSQRNVFKRIGIFMAPQMYDRAYGVDFMAMSKETRVTIV